MIDTTILSSGGGKSPQGLFENKVTKNNTSIVRKLI